MSRVVLLVTSPRVPVGLLSWDAWASLRGGPVLTDDADSPWVVPLESAGVAIEVVDGGRDPREVAAELAAAATETGVACWLVAAGDGQPLVQALADLPDDPHDRVEVEVLHGSWDAPGMRLLDAVALMDRLRSPGGCPWDAEQDHDSLARYLLEESYETVQAIEDGDPEALRAELGDVLLQVLFHARIAEESETEPWSVDDVAAGLVDKLIRRHPHVFEAAAAGSAGQAPTAQVSAAGVPAATDLQASWETIKSAERGERSAVADVPLVSPALTLAATLQRKAGRLGVPAELVAPTLAAASSPDAAVRAEVSRVAGDPSVSAAGDLLWAVVAMLAAADLDPEAALRGRGRDFRAELMAAEAELRGSGRDPAAVEAGEWARSWPAGRADPD